MSLSITFKTFPPLFPPRIPCPTTSFPPVRRTRSLAGEYFSSSRAGKRHPPDPRRGTRSSAPLSPPSPALAETQVRESSGKDGEQLIWGIFPSLLPGDADAVGALWDAEGPLEPPAASRWGDVRECCCPLLGGCGQAARPCPPARPPACPPACHLSCLSSCLPALLLSISPACLLTCHPNHRLAPGCPVLCTSKPGCQLAKGGLGVTSVSHPQLRVAAAGLV